MLDRGGGVVSSKEIFNVWAGGGVVSSVALDCKSGFY